MDLHLEEFSDFGIGTNEFLKKVRLHTQGILSRTDLQEIYSLVKAASGGSMSCLGRFDIDRADRELYKFFSQINSRSSSRRRQS